MNYYLAQLGVKRKKKSRDRLVSIIVFASPATIFLIAVLFLISNPPLILSTLPVTFVSLAPLLP